MCTYDRSRIAEQTQSGNITDGPNAQVCQMSITHWKRVSTIVGAYHYYLALKVHRGMRKQRLMLLCKDILIIQYVFKTNIFIS